MAAPQAPPATQPWPRAVGVTFLTAFVLVDGALWAIGLYYLMALNQRVETALWEPKLFQGILFVTYALLLMLLAGWAWRWWVARGWIGGRPTARFGGT